MTTAVMAIDCGGTSTRVAATTFDGTMPGGFPVVHSMATPTLDALVPAILAAWPEQPVAAIGVGVAGLVDRGSLVWMPHRSGPPVALEAELRAATGLPVVVANDATLAAVAEAIHGAGSGHRMVLMVTVGTGIGGGLVVDGVIERGRGHLGEIGHLALDPTGTPCRCGQTGCWETVASGRALDDAARRFADADPRGEFARRLADGGAPGAVLMAAAADGDDLAEGAVRAVAEAFGRGLASLVAGFDPDVIVVGGGVGATGEQFLQPARRAMMAATPGGAFRPETPVVAAHFGDRAGLVGAAMVAMEVLR